MLVGIIDDYLLGQFFLPRRFIDTTYLYFLDNAFPAVLEDVELEVAVHL